MNGPRSLLAREFILTVRLRPPGVSLPLHGGRLFERIRMFLSNKQSCLRSSPIISTTVPSVLAQMMPAPALLAALIKFGSSPQTMRSCHRSQRHQSLHRIDGPYCLPHCLPAAELSCSRIRHTPPPNWACRIHQVCRGTEEKGMGGFQGEPDLVQSQNASAYFKLFVPSENRIQVGSDHYLVFTAVSTSLSRIDARESPVGRGNRWETPGTCSGHYLFGREFPVNRNGLPTLAVDIAENTRGFQCRQKSADQMASVELRKLHPQTAPGGL